MVTVSFHAGAVLVWLLGVGGCFLRWQNDSEKRWCSVILWTSGFILLAFSFNDLAIHFGGPPRLSPQPPVE